MDVDNGRVAVVTGGASGIGEGIVRRFVADGGRCVIADLHVERAEALAAELGDAVIAERVDVTQEADLASVVDLAVARFGRLDCMFNNAGMLGVVGSIVDHSLDAWNQTMEVLSTSVFLGIREAARVMIPQGGGAIVNTASTAGVRGGLGPHGYTAAKVRSRRPDRVNRGRVVGAQHPGQRHRTWPDRERTHRRPDRWGPR